MGRTTAHAWLRRRTVAVLSLSLCQTSCDAFAVTPTQQQPHTFRSHTLVGTLRANPSSSDQASSAPSDSESLYIPDDYERPFYPKPRQIDEALLGDLTGGRPGAIIETEAQLELKAQILSDIDTHVRSYDEASTGGTISMQDYGNLLQDTEADWDDPVVANDPTALDAATLGTWTIADLKSKFPYEWDPTLQGEDQQPDPNLVALQQPGVRYVSDLAIDEDGVELGYDPLFGPSSPVDGRTIQGARDSYMVDDATRNDDMVPLQFRKDDAVEPAFQAEVVQFRKSLDVMETYTDEFLKDVVVDIPRHVAQWHGYPDQVFLDPKPFENNRFTETPTDFDALTPYEARVKAVELARAKNAEWLPEGVSLAWHAEERQPYEDHATLVGTLRPGVCDPALVAQIQPALTVLGSSAKLLSIGGGDVEGTGTVFRFAYHGLMKNKHGMMCWTETMLRDCGVTVTGVVMETGFRKRDQPYDGGDPWNGPTF